jgi:hypothetical protein
MYSAPSEIRLYVSYCSFQGTISQWFSVFSDSWSGGFSADGNNYRPDALKNKK